MNADRAVCAEDIGWQNTLPDQASIGENAQRGARDLGTQSVRQPFAAPDRWQGTRVFRRNSGSAPPAAIAVGMLVWIVLNRNDDR